LQPLQMADGVRIVQHVAALLSAATPTFPSELFRREFTTPLYSTIYNLNARFIATSEHMTNLRSD
jgi:hypothetical protein